jgi:hypothetical protein
MSILDVAIKAEGGVGKLANALDVKQNVVSNWRKRGLPKPWAKLLTRDYSKHLRTTKKEEKAV